jgi:AcrR family transcriptional regulator
VPKVVDPERRRGDLAGAAVRVIARIGLEGVTVQAVAEEAGCSAGSLAHYFRSKDELLVHALRTSTEALIRPLRESQRIGSSGTIESLTAIALRSLPLDPAREREWRVRLAFWARASGPPEEVQLERQYLAEWRMLWETAIRAAQASGDVRDDVDARKAGTGIVAIIVGTATQLLIHSRATSTQFAEVVESYVGSFGISTSQ